MNIAAVPIIGSGIYALLSCYTYSQYYNFINLTLGMHSLCNIVATICKKFNEATNGVCWMNHPAVYSCPEYGNM